MLRFPQTMFSKKNIQKIKLNKFIAVCLTFLIFFVFYISFSLFLFPMSFLYFLLCQAFLLAISICIISIASC